MKGLVLTVLTMAAFVSQSVMAQEVSPEIRKVGVARLTLAETLIEALDAGLVCDADAYPSEINRLISSASMQLDQVVIEDWVAALPANSKIKSDLAFRQATNSVTLDGTNPSASDIEKQLIGTKFHAFGMGVYGSQYNVVLEKGGIAKVATLEHLEKEPWTKWVSSKSTWAVVLEKTSYGKKAKLKIGTIEFDFETKTGEIWLVPTNVPAAEVQEKTLTTTDAYCEA